MPQHKGEVVIKYNAQTGERTMEVMGVKGPTCQDLLKGLERYLGDAGDRQLKDEFHDTQTNMEGEQNAHTGGF